MRFMAKAVVGVALVSALCVSTATAEKKARTPDPEDIQGVWIGIDSSFDCFYRCEFDADGKGKLTVVENGKTGMPLRIDAWKLVDREIQIRFNEADQSASEYRRVLGQYRYNCIDFLIEGYNYEREVTLWNEAKWRERERLALDAPPLVLPEPPSPKASSAKPFSFRVEDGLGRPVEDVQIRLSYTAQDQFERYLTVPLFEGSTREDGTIEGTYDARQVPKDDSPWVNFAKDGYTSYSSSEVEKVFVVERAVTLNDLDRAMVAEGSIQTELLREFLCSDWDGLEYDVEAQTDTVTSRIFHSAESIRSSLRALLKDERTFDHAAWLLTMIGYPDDVRQVLQHAPKRAKDEFDDRWAYVVAAAMLTPESDAEWDFLRRCAMGKYATGWPQIGAIITLRYLASPQSLALLKDIPPKADDSGQAIGAIKYVEDAPVPIRGNDLAALGLAIAQAMPIGTWQRNEEPQYDETGRLARIESEYTEGRDVYIYSATYHQVNGDWVFRGTRETMQMYTY